MHRLPSSVLTLLVSGQQVCKRARSSVGSLHGWHALTTVAERSTSADDVYDVAIVGGGMVGAAVAALLGSKRLTSQLRVAVLDVKPQPTTFQPRPVPDLRVSTVTPGSIEVLRQAGAWDQVEAQSAAFNLMQVWDSSSSGYIQWNAAELGATRMGVVAENALLQAALLAAAQRSGGGTEFLWPAEVRALRLPPPEGQAAVLQGTPAPSQNDREGGDADGQPPITSRASDCTDTSTPGQQPCHGLAELELSDGRVLACRLVVAADGASSRIRQMAGLRTWGWGYGQRGLVATVATSEPSEVAWQRFLPMGPLALLPVRDGFSNIVWSTTPEAATALEAMGPEEFASAVNKALQDPRAAPFPLQSGAGPQLASLASSMGQLAAQVAAGVGLPGAAAADQAFLQPPLVLSWEGSRPRSFPLQLKQAGRYVLPRLALVGDAAHAVHPLAGQGVNLGFGDARALAEALAMAVETGTDPGDARMLYESYEAPRRRSVLTMTAALDGIKRAFQVQAPGLAALRGVGLNLINAVGPLRNGIMQYAMMGQA